MGGRGGRRPVDAEIHLVPLIDLLSSLISFLLMTAVWVQVSRLELKNGSAGPETASTAPSDAPLPWRVHIHPRGFTVVEPASHGLTQIPCLASECARIERQPDASGRPTPQVVSSYDYGRLGDVLAKLKAQAPERKDVIIQLDDRVPYNEMIHTMDVCLGLGLDGISLSGTAS
jgi:biopolymer transport protein ExbD